MAGTVRIMHDDGGRAARPMIRGAAMRVPRASPKPDLIDVFAGLSQPNGDSMAPQNPARERLRAAPRCRAGLEWPPRAAVSYSFPPRTHQTDMNALHASAGGDEVAAIAAAVRGKVEPADATTAEAFAKLTCAELGPDELA